MNSNHFKYDYDLKRLKKISVDDFEMWITPRYFHHYQENEYESYSSDLIKTYLNEGSVFVDVGAHYGYFSILASKSYENVEVIAIEPVLENFKILEKNIDINNLNQISTHNVAISDKNETKEFNITHASDSSGFYSHPFTDSKEKISVVAQTLDTILDKKHVDFIKIDVEGHEIEALSGLKKTLKGSKCKLLIEFFPEMQVSAGNDPTDMLKMITSLGYEIFFINDEKKRHYRYTGNKYSWEELLDSNKYCNLFCIPQNESLSVSYFSHLSSLEGAERSLIDLIRQVSNYGVMSHLVIPSEGPILDKLSDMSVSQSICETSWWTGHSNQAEMIINLDKSLDNLRKIISDIEKINPHIIYTNTSVIPWGALIASFLNKPHAWHIHEFGELDHGLQFDLTLDESMNLVDMFSDTVIFNSNAVKKELGKGIDTIKSDTVYYNVEINESLKNEVVDTPFKNSNSLKLIIAGTIKPSKGQDQVVSAVVSLLDEGADIELLVLGKKYSENDNYFQELQEKSKQYLKSNIHYMDFVDNPYPYFKLSDVSVSCSSNEAFGRTTVEAMLLGKPIIGSNSGATIEIVENGKSGYLYTNQNINSLKEKISLFDSNRRLLKKMGNYGRKLALKQYSVDLYAGKIYRLLSEFKSTTKSLTNTKSLAKSYLESSFSKRDVHHKKNLNNEETIVSLRKKNSEIESKLETLKSKLTTQKNAYTSLSDQYTQICQDIEHYYSLKNEIHSKHQLKVEYQNQLDMILNSKFYKSWQFIVKIKGVF